MWASWGLNQGVGRAAFFPGGSGAICYLAFSSFLRGLLYSLVHGLLPYSTPAAAAPTLPATCASHGLPVSLSCCHLSSHGHQSTSCGDGGIGPSTLPGCTERDVGLVVFVPPRTLTSYEQSFPLRLQTLHLKFFIWSFNY